MSHDQRLSGNGKKTVAKRFSRGRITGLVLIAVVTLVLGYLHFSGGSKSVQANGDRAEEARILSEMASTHLRRGDSTLARQAFLESAQAYQDIASVRGVGLSLIGLAAANASEGRNVEALKIAAAAEVYARQDGIVNVYTEQPVGRDFIETAGAELSAEDVTNATEVGRLLTISEALELARGPARTPRRTTTGG